MLLLAGDFFIYNPLVQMSDLRVRIRVTLRLAVYRQSVRLGSKPHVAHDQSLAVIILV
jgi:hypothetical protein